MLMAGGSSTVKVIQEMNAADPAIRRVLFCAMVYHSVNAELKAVINPKRHQGSDGFPI